MTETSAGSIYNAADCPAYHLSRNSEFTCLGECTPGISFRIVNTNGSEAAVDEIGELEVKGEVVFKKYYNDPDSTKKNFSSEGWFKTGDRGFKDTNGRLHLTGRDKDTVVINWYATLLHNLNTQLLIQTRIHYHPHTIESAIEFAKIKGVTPTFIVAFAFRPKDSSTELLLSSTCRPMMSLIRHQVPKSPLQSQKMSSPTVVSDLI